MEGESRITITEKMRNVSIMQVTTMRKKIARTVPWQAKQTQLKANVLPLRGHCREHNYQMSMIDSEITSNSKGY